MYSHFVGPLVTQALNNYTMEIELEHPVIGQTTKDKFVLDYKNTRSPNVDPNFIDFFFEGELLHGNHKCVLEPEKMAFMNSKTASQLVISESAATCIANSMANSGIGRTFLDKERINKMFQTYDLEFDTTSLSG